MALSFRKINPRAAAMTAVMMAILICLGCWQMKRLAWKEDMLAHMRAGMDAPVRPLPEIITAPDDLAYARFVVTGQFLDDQSFTVGPRGRDGKTGFFVITPLQRISGDIVLVNRGWLPYQAVAAVPQTDDIVQVTARARPYEKKPFFMPPNDPAQGKWTWFDIPLIAQAIDTQGAEVLPVILDEIKDAPADPALPLPALFVTDVPNNHKAYAMFWFGMAGVLLIVFLISQTRRGALA